MEALQSSNVVLCCNLCSTVFNFVAPVNSLVVVVRHVVLCGVLCLGLLNLVLFGLKVKLKR